MSDWIQRLKDARVLLELGEYTQAEFDSLKNKILLERGLDDFRSSKVVKQRSESEASSAQIPTIASDYLVDLLPFLRSCPTRKNNQFMEAPLRAWLLDHVPKPATACDLDQRCSHEVSRNSPKPCLATSLGPRRSFHTLGTRRVEYQDSVSTLRKGVSFRVDMYCTAVLLFAWTNVRFSQ